MTFRIFGVSTAMLALALSACGNSSDANNGAAPDQPAQAAKAAGDQTIASGLDKNGRFYKVRTRRQAAAAVCGMSASMTSSARPC